MNNSRNGLILLAVLSFAGAAVCMVGVLMHGWFSALPDANQERALRGALLWGSGAGLGLVVGLLALRGLLRSRQ